jgi:LPXTG-motif cell wall-anchored protein
MIRFCRSVVANGLLVLALIVTTLALASPPAVSARPVAQGAQLSIRITDAGVEAPASVPAGLVEFNVENTTNNPLFILVARMKAGKTIEDLKATLSLPPEQQGGAAFALLESSGGFGANPGSRSRAVLTLREGPNVINIQVEAENAQPILQPLQVTASSAAGPEPAAELTANLRDFTIEMPAEVRAGTQTWKIVNQGPQPHELIYVKILPGKTFERDVLPLVLQDSPQGPPPGPSPFDVTTFGGLAPMEAGLSGWIDVSLTPGNWVALCFVTDPATNKPHDALGMATPFTVRGAGGPPALPSTGEAPIPVALPNTGSSSLTALWGAVAVCLLVLGVALRRSRRA